MVRFADIPIRLNQVRYLIINYNLLEKLVLLPILAEVAINIKVHPLCLMYPATLSCAMGFHTIFGEKTKDAIS